MAYSVIGEDFAAWVKQGVELRNQKLASEKNLLIEVDAEIANAFHNSTSVSCKCPSFPPQQAPDFISD